MTTNKLRYIKHTASIFFLTAVLIMTSCTDFGALNTPDDEIVVDENTKTSLIGKAFAESQQFGWLAANGSGAGAFQLGQSLYTDINAQYFATTAPNFDSDQYVEIGGWSNGVWNHVYGDAAPQLNFVLDITKKRGLKVMNAIAKVWKVVFYSRISDLWGPIIYSEFGNGETVVPYDSQESVYKSFFPLLDEAVAVLKKNKGKNVFGINDLVYQGDVNKWLTFANSLRLRMAMRIKYVEPTLAKKQAEKAVAAGVMLDNSANAKIKTTADSKNPYTIITNWGEFRMSAAMESVLDGYNDPRMAEYFAPAAFGDDDGDGNPYEGMRNGLTKLRKSSSPPLNKKYSDMATKYMNKASGGTNPPLRVMSAAEVYFLRAEGALEGWNMGGTAEGLYNKGIRTSLNERTDATNAEITAYINSMKTPVSPQGEWDTPAMTDIPVKFDSDGSKQRKLEQIITQKWIALYPNSFEAWAEYRRTGYPKLYPRINSKNPNIAVDEDFQRLTFVLSEYDNNGEAVKKAVEMLGGPDDANYTELWWDAKGD